MTYQKITIPLDHGNRNMKTVEEALIAVQQDGWALRYVPDHLKDTRVGGNLG